MQHPTRNFTPVVALLAIAALLLGNGCGSNTGGSGGTGGSGDNRFVGTYVELFSCQLDDGTCLEVNVRIRMEVTLDGGQYEIDDLGSNAVATGTSTGDVLNWTNMDPDFPGFSESGNWAFTFETGSTKFVKNSAFMQDQGSSGTCKGNGRLESEGEPDDVPAFMPPCIPQ